MSRTDRYDSLRARWRAAWPDALAAWGPYTRLHAPTLHGRDGASKDVGSFAWFSTSEVEVHIDLDRVVADGLEDHAVAVLAHEVGHHMLSPADLTTSALLIARARAGLVDLDDAAPLVANLWSDLLINDRLQRRAGVDMVGVWRALGRPTGMLMQTMMRTDELLWELPRGLLTAPRLGVPEREATLAARLVRAYADDPVGGVAGFASLLRTMVGEPTDKGELKRVRGVVCGQVEPPDAVPTGLATDPRTVAPVRHPALDPRVVGDLGLDEPPDETVEPADPAGSETASADGGGLDDTGQQTLAPADYAATLRLLGLPADARTAARRWYREHAAPLLVPFPVREQARSREPLLGGYEPWDVGDDLADVDWTGSLLRSPVVVPGVTTVRRATESDVGDEPDRVPVDLDLYLDSSGSMPDPAKRIAPIALAGAVLALSALRAGARVQATTWSGAGQIAGTDGFVRDPERVLDAIVAHFGGGTSFPLPLLEATHLGSPTATAPPTRTRTCHVAVISDDGVSSMFPDVTGGPGRGEGGRVPPADGLAARAVAAAGGGGTLVLDTSVQRAQQIGELAAGFRVHAVTSHDDLVAFARAFARETWGTGSTREGRRRAR